MALTVGEVRELPIAETFRLVAGASGLNRLIEHVNLLDFEYDTWEPDAEFSDGIFDRKSIIVTSLLFAKDKPEKIYPVVRQLYVDGVSALAVKAVYYKELPPDVIDFANEKGLPIFLFDSEANFSENVVVGLTMAIDEHDNIDGLEEKVTFLLQENLKSVNRYKIMEELFPEFDTPFQCIYFMPKEIHSTFSYHQLILSLRSKKGKNIIVLPYQKGILVTLYGKEELNLAGIMDCLDLASSEYYCGVSKLSNKRNEVTYKIQESLYACNYGRSKGIDISRFDNMGIRQIILPNKENYWMRSYCDSIVEKIKAYDADGSCELYNTIVCYVRNACDVNKAAKEMLVHKNTIRYRISKAKEILGLEDETSEFNEIIFFVVYFHETKI